MTTPSLFADMSLARRLERAEGRSCADFVDARETAEASWVEIDGAYAMFDGVDSPLTQTFALGIGGDGGDAVLDQVEAFFKERSAPVFHEVCPLADPTLLERLQVRGYRAIEHSSVLFRSIDRDVRLGDVPGDVQVRAVTGDEIDVWGQTAAAGWREFGDELAAFMVEAARLYKKKAGTTCFLAELDGEPVAAGALSLVEGVALLAGASTVPAARRRGAQLALLQARLRHAASEGCDVAMMGAMPGSASQRNAERHGFRIAYTRTKWERH